MKFPAAYYIDHSHSATRLSRLSPRGPNNMRFNSPLELWSQRTSPMIQLVVMQFSSENVVVGKYHDLADSEVFQVILTYYLLIGRHIA